MKEKSLSCMFSTDLFKLCSNVANCSSNCQLNQLPVTWKSFCLSQIRPLNCGKWVRETRDQRDTTWKMRRDGSRTSLPSPLCRCAHTQTHTYASLRVHMYQVDVRLAGPMSTFLCLYSNLHMIPDFRVLILTFICLLLSFYRSFFPSFFL